MSSPPSSPGYRRRQPELTPLYDVIAGHVATFRDHIEEHYERGLPRYVEKEFDESSFVTST